MAAGMNHRGTELDGANKTGATGENCGALKAGRSLPRESDRLLLAPRVMFAMARMSISPDPSVVVAADGACPAEPRATGRGA